MKMRYCMPSLQDAGRPGPMTVLTEAPPVCTADDARRLLAGQYAGLGPVGAVRPLRGERDRNFVVRAGDLDAVLKVSHSSEPDAVIDMENAPMEFVAAHGDGVRVPRLLRTGD